MNYSFIIRKAVESDAEAIHNILKEALRTILSVLKLMKPLNLRLKL